MHLFLSLTKKETCQIKLTFLQLVLKNIFLNFPSGYYRSNDKQQRDKQATCDTSPGFPREPVWLTYWQGRLKDQRDQRGRGPFLSSFLKGSCFSAPKWGQKTSFLVLSHLKYQTLQSNFSCFSLP